MRYTDTDRDEDELMRIMQEKTCSEEIMWISDPNHPSLSSNPEPKQPEKELVLFAFYSKSVALVVWCNEGFVEWECGEVGPVEVSGYILDNKCPDHGIWVWEGKVICSNRCNMDGEYDDPEYRTIQWRQPTEEEWEAIKEQRNPFMPKPKEEQEWSNWGQKTVL